MITYPVTFFGATKNQYSEDFESYDTGRLKFYPQIWQSEGHFWLNKNRLGQSTYRTAGIITKDFGVSGAFADFESLETGLYSWRQVFESGAEGNWDFSNNEGVHYGFVREFNNHPSGWSAELILRYGDVNQNWGESGVVPGLWPADQFGAKIISQFIVTQTGTYTFHVKKDDLAKVWIGKQEGFYKDPIIDDYSYGFHVTGSYVSSSAIEILETGRWNIKAHYAEFFGEANLKLEWSGPFSQTLMTPQDFGVITPLFGYDFSGVKLYSENISNQISILAEYSILVPEIYFSEELLKNSAEFGGVYFLKYAENYSSEKVDVCVRFPGYHVFAEEVYFSPEDSINLSKKLASHYAFHVSETSGRDKAKVSVNPVFYHIFATKDTGFTERARSSGRFEFYSAKRFEATKGNEIVKNEANPSFEYFEKFSKNYNQEKLDNNLLFDSTYFSKFEHSLSQENYRIELSVNSHYDFSEEIEFKNEETKVSLNKEFFHDYFVKESSSQEQLKTTASILFGYGYPEIERLYKNACHNLLGLQANAYFKREESLTVEKSISEASVSFEIFDIRLKETNQEKAKQEFSIDFNAFNVRQTEKYEESFFSQCFFDGVYELEFPITGAFNPLTIFHFTSVRNHCGHKNSASIKYLYLDTNSFSV